MPKYFKAIPTIRYDSFDDTGNSKVVTNIFARVRAKLEAKTDRAVYYKYTVPDGQSPEVVAKKYYGSENYMWVVLLFNDMIDPKFDWVLNHQEFRNYVKNKYGSLELAEETVHHYETLELRAPASAYGYSQGDIILPKGIEVDEDFTYSYGSNSGDYYFNTLQSRKSVSQYDYEDALNENKRNIRLLKASYLPQIVEEFEGLVRNKK